jgi:hypothetical protein
MAGQIKVEPKSDYQKMLHDNYHIAQKLGPARDCPYCPQKPEAS